jgi:hypothetical protein
MECFICGKVINEGYLCKEHSELLHNMLKSKEGVVNTPDSRHHCSICGKYEDRVIIEFPYAGYFCNIDIEEQYEIYINKKE